jgi:hypothetical protein
VGPRAGLYAGARRKIPSPYRDSNPDKPVAQCYTAGLSRLLEISQTLHRYINALQTNITFIVQDLKYVLLLLLLLLLYRITKLSS